MAPEKKKVDAVSMDEFIRTRDSVVTGLTKLNGAISTLISAYVTHTNQLLGHSGHGDAVVDLDSVANLLINNNADLAPKAPVDALDSKKKKRAKKDKDPNAPKRPLTAFFLFSTRARELIKKDLGPAASPVDINDEILRRWNGMDVLQKQKWKTVYSENYERYKADVADYKRSTSVTLEPEPEEDADIEATLRAQLVAATSDANPAASSDVDDSASDSDSAPPPPPSSKPKKAAAAAAAVKAKKVSTSSAPPEPKSNVSIPLAGEAAKRKKKDAPEAGRKKRKGEPGGDAQAAPVPQELGGSKKKGPKKRKE